MNDEPREYDREWTVPIGSRARKRTGISVDQGEVVRFVVQLEYRLRGEWTPVVRYDHDPASDHGHDVAEEGLHIDVYRNGKQARRDWVAPPMPAGVALDFAEDHLGENLERFIRRFEEWHSINRA